MDVATVAVLLERGGGDTLLDETDELDARRRARGRACRSGRSTAAPLIVQAVVVAPMVDVGADCTVTPVGTASATLTERATDGPALVTSIVHRGGRARHDAWRRRPP